MTTLIIHINCRRLPCFGQLSCIEIPKLGINIRRQIRKMMLYLASSQSSDSDSAQVKLFGIVNTRYMPMINRICFSYSDSKEDFEDLRQDILVNVWKGLSGYKAEAAFSTWLYRVALNTCVSTIRIRKRRPSTVSLQELNRDITDNVSDSALRENLQMLHKCIAALNPVEKAIITMWLDECPYEEIAEVVGISLSNVGVRINRIKKKMASQMKKD